jgi:glycosyltransferase involved in cell wall biosynthesis
MRIGLNLLYLLPGIVGGTETYASGLLHGLAKIDKQNEYFVFVNRESAVWPIPQANNFVRVVCPLAASNRAKRYFFEQMCLPWLLSRHKIDLIHSLGYVGPLWTGCPAVVSVLDLNYIAIGHTMPAYKRCVLRIVSGQAAKRAKAVITISNYSKNAICDSGRIAREKTFVTLLGPQWDQKDWRANDPRKIRKQYGVRGSYLAAFGGRALHKNIPRLLQVFAKIKNEFPHKLLLIGHLPANVKPVDLSDGIITTGYVPTEHIIPLLSGAEVFVLPTLYEGFGLPVLEAQQAGVPVVCSNAGSLPEVAGEGALFFDPYSIEDMKEKLTRVLGDKDLKETLRQKALSNVKRFSWEKTALDTLAVYNWVYGKWRDA